MIEKIIRFLKETRMELTKVTWPTKDEIIGSTIVTVVVSVILAAFIGVVDFILDKGVRTLFS
jgi:preprotein translocase subunit SecE